LEKSSRNLSGCRRFKSFEKLSAFDCHKGPIFKGHVSDKALFPVANLPHFKIDYEIGVKGGCHGNPYFFFSLEVNVHWATIVAIEFLENIVATIIGPGQICYEGFAGRIGAQWVKNNDKT
jgi:hypothetical protein